MKLFILRHGKAVNIKEGSKDFDKKLSEEGILQAIKIADYLKDKQIQQIIYSSATRTSETASIIDQIIHVDEIDFDDSLYLADSQTIKDVISEFGNKENLLYVGHNFGISDFTGEITGHNINMSTCMLIEVEMEIDDWKLLSNETGILKKITEPNNL